MSYEVRSFAGPENIDASDDGVIFGLAIPYNRSTNIGDPKHGGFEERIAPGSCTKSLRESDIVALWNHDSAQPLGRTSAGNLKLVNATRGVEPELKPVDTSYARDLAELVRSRVVRGWSFGFEVVKDEWTDDAGEPADQWTGTKRTIREMKLIEVSPVTFPAYDQTEIASRSALLEAREERAKAAPAGRGSQSEAPQPGGDVRDIKSAWAYLHKAKIAAAYDAPQLADLKERVRSAADARGLAITEASAQEWRCYLKAHDPMIVIEGRASEDRKLKNGTAKRIAQINVILAEALDAFKECDLDKLPDAAQRAASLISSAAEHSGHIMHKEHLGPSDGVEGHDNRDQETSAEKRDQPEPDGESTPAESLSDDALRLAYMEAVSRSVEMGL